MELKKKLFFEKYFLSKPVNIPLIVVLIFIIVLAIYNSFIQDDAFISFRYAQNLVKHNNFTWNILSPERLEGYTNFLWTILISLFIKLQMDPVMGATLLGLFTGLGTLIVSYMLGYIVLKDYRYSLIYIFLLGTNYSFSSYITGGLETQLQCFLLSGVCLIFFKLMVSNDQRIFFLFLSGFLSALAILTRLDSLLYLGCLVLIVTYHRFELNHNKILASIFDLVCMGIPVIAIVVPWLFWKYHYYGDLLPNSFYLKGNVHSFDVLKAGFRYVIVFLCSYFFIVFAFLVPVQIKVIIRQKFISAILIVVIAWLAYIVKVGGDFMEFRFLIPILPLLILFLVWGILQLESRLLKYFCVAIILTGSISHWYLFDGWRGIEPIKQLNGHIYNANANWKGIGIQLNKLFGSVKHEIVIATSAAGAIPYYSELETIDMLGVNDKQIALSGENIQYFRAGHNKWAKLDHYINTNVNLVLGHPQVKKKDWAQGREFLSLNEFDNFMIANLEKDQLPRSAKIVTIPLDNDFDFYVLYLMPLPEIDTLIEQGIISSYKIE